jgi:hypothetical protein
MNNKFLKLTVLLMLPIFLSSCGSEGDVMPTAVVESVDEEAFGKTDNVIANLRTGEEIINGNYAINKSLSKVTMDYLNIKSGTVIFNINWPTSIGLGYFHIVSVLFEKKRITLASLDNLGTCWYIEITEDGDKTKSKYGASDDQSCKASSREKNEINWSEIDFPLSVSSLSK